MKKSNRIYIFSIFIMILAFVGIQGCRKVSHNGSLDGQWQIIKIEDTSTGEISEGTPHGYISVNLHILQLRGLTSDMQTSNMRYDKEEGIIDCDFPYVNANDISKLLQPYGIYTNPVQFKIEKLSGENLILRTDHSIITCRKF